MQVIGYDEADPLLEWVELAEELEAGHRQPKAQVGDQFLTRRDDTVLSRAAIIDGIGIAVKTATVFPGNAEFGMPSINGAMVLFSDRTGIAEAMIDFRLATKWKTAGDSLLAAKHLARPESNRILIVGAGTVARSLVEAYSTTFEGAEFQVWNRTPSNADAMVAEMSGRFRMVAVRDLAEAAGRSDIIATATMSCEPVIRGEWLAPGTHLNLVGAYRSDMREADDTAIKRSRVFVDSRETTIGHIGEIKQPLERGIIGEDDILADFHDISKGAFRRTSSEEITLFKNGGGAHLDLMTARYILRRWNRR